MLHINIPESDDYIHYPEKDFSSINDNSIDDGVNTAVYFDKGVLQSVKDINGANGIRFYPGLDGDEIVMVAVPAQGPLQDLSNNEDFCGVGYGAGSQKVSRIISVEKASGMKNAEGASSENQALLAQIVLVGNDSRSLKVYFTNNDLNPYLTTPGSHIQFDVIQLSFNVGNVLKSIGIKENNQIGLSRLPCPPHCGSSGGAYDVTFVSNFLQ